ncbi:MAG: molybdopterin-synthase adenylyltransferase MoeB [Gammaproteobacteria bacterium]
METHERIRYARHLGLAELGEAGQQRLRDATVLIVGLGGLGSPAALYLAAAGVGRLLLNDFDLVDPTNLQRQVLYRDADVGRRKVDAASDALACVNPAVSLVRHDGRLDSDALRTVIDGADLVLDCTDNFGSRFTVNGACVAAGTRLVSGAAVRLGGQVASFDLRDGIGPCYACLYREAGESIEDCAGNGVLASLVGVIGTMLATEALRIIGGIGAPASGRLLQFNAATLSWRESTFDRDPACTVCR